MLRFGKEKYGIVDYFMSFANHCMQLGQFYYALLSVWQLSLFGVLYSSAEIFVLDKHIIICHLLVYGVQCESFGPNGQKVSWSIEMQSCFILSLLVAFFCLYLYSNHLLFLRTVLTLFTLIINSTANSVATNKLNLVERSFGCLCFFFALNNLYTEQ